MDQYPDENEEFELQYQDELQMMDNLAREEVLSKEFATQKNPNTVNSSCSPSKMHSPQLSQISYGFKETDQYGEVHAKRFFGTPKNPQRTSSTPITTKQNLSPPRQVNLCIDQLQRIGLRSKRKLERDLFGDIDDIDIEHTYIDPIAKKARNEEERDLKIIENIIESRKKVREGSNNPRRGHMIRLNEIHEFKKRNLSYCVPPWPFLPLLRSDDERIYVRFHSGNYEDQMIDTVSTLPDGTSDIFGKNKMEIWTKAQEIVAKRFQPSTLGTEMTTRQSEMMEKDDEVQLWVDKYKPKKYVDLLSDENTNRSLLYWLKMWDKVVFRKEFKGKNIVERGQMNSFNRKTGRFETNGVWRARKQQQTLIKDVDDLGRPMQKVALLCGPSGFGKTTLAHTIVKHAGYNVREVNASDDRNLDAFKLALENGTQMTSVLDNEGKPNCIILDEIDGAPKQSVEFLIKFVTDNVFSKFKARRGKSQRNILKRPIICICNDIYEPSLRPLRQIAFIVNVPSIQSDRLAERLAQIAHKEHLKTDFVSLMALVKKTGNDVRCCISTMQFFNASKQKLTLHDVLDYYLGEKDRHHGLFDVWTAIFNIQRPKKHLEGNYEHDGVPVTITNMMVHSRTHNVLEMVHSCGDYERLRQGVYENYLQQKMPDPNLDGIIEGNQWFCFSDILNHQINQLQNYTLYPYLQFGFVAWHFLFGSFAWPKIVFPSRGFEFQQRSVTCANVLKSVRNNIAPNVFGAGQAGALLMETVPLLKRILLPQLRPVALQLLSSRERYDLRHSVEVMVDFGLNYRQFKSTEGSYVFQMEPDLELLSKFPGMPHTSLSYFSKQLIAREMELECMKRLMPKVQDSSTTVPGNVKVLNEKKQNVVPTNRLPNYLQTFTTKAIKRNDDTAASCNTITKDFFGRIQQKPSPSAACNSKADLVLKSLIWYRYKEGFNNAVRKDVQMKDLI